MVKINNKGYDYNDDDNQKLKLLIKNLREYKKLKNKEKIVITLFKLSQYYYNHLEFRKAKLALNSIFTIKKDIPKVNFYLAEIAIAENQNLKAIKYLEKEIKISPFDRESKLLKEKLIVNNNFPIITLFLIFLNSIIFYFTYPQISLVQLIKYTLNLGTIDIFNAITSMFFHVNSIHFFSNMIMLLLFGLILEKQIGSFKFFIIYFISGFFANLVEVFFSSTNNFVLGASGAIFAIIGSLIIIKPRLEIKLFGIIKIPLIIVFGGYFIFAGIIMNFFNFTSLHSAQISHIVGFLLGLLITGIMYKDKITVLYSWSSITFGFYMISLAITDYLWSYFISNDVLINYFDLLISFIYIVFGIYIIIFAYKILNYMRFDE